MRFEPLFAFKNGQPLDKGSFVSYIRSLLLAIGVPPEGYTGHSLRAGSATQAYQNGWEGPSIKNLGHWQSDCYQKYIRLSANQLAYFASQLV